MPIQFPNFLNAQTHKPDFSGIGDIVENYYRGKMLPKEDLIKSIQAKFAQPNAEANLKSTQLQNIFQEIVNQFAPEKNRTEIEDSKLKNVHQGLVNQFTPEDYRSIFAARRANLESTSLSNQQGKITLQKMLSDLAQEKKFQTQLENSLGNSQSSEAGGMTPMGSPPISSNESIISQGSPHLAAIDTMYDNSPASRDFLEKKGYKKSQKVEFDKKTGKTSVITKYPSGKITVQSSGDTASEDGIPLTSKMVTKHQNIVSSVDVAIPVLEELAKMGSYPRQSFFKGGQYAQYEGLVSQAVDSVIGSFGLPMTNEGLKTVRDQIEIKRFETPSHYKNRIEQLIKDLRSRQSYSNNAVKKSNKIRPVDNSDSSSEGNKNNYSSNEWEAV